MTRAMPRKLDPDSETQRLQLIAPGSWVARVNDWRSEQRPIPNFSEAVRRLGDIGLESELKKREKKGGRK